MTLPNDVARCPGLSEAGHHSPIRLCMRCARYWGQADAGANKPLMRPPAGIRDMRGVEIYCDSRIPQQD